MLFSLLIIIVFVVISIYYYFNAEKLQYQLLVVKKEAALIKKESKSMTDSFAAIAKNNEEFVNFRFDKILETQKTNEVIELLKPLINNYSTIFRESIRSKGQTHKVAHKCCESYNGGSYKRLTVYIDKQDAHLKRLWKSNNLNGFMSFIEAILIQLEGENENK